MIHVASFGDLKNRIKFQGFAPLFFSSTICGVEYLIDMHVISLVKMS